jgi:hypothetical protein
MAKDERLPKVRVNFFDGQRVTEADLDDEQIYNLTTTSEAVVDFHGSGVINAAPFEESILLDTRFPGTYVENPEDENSSKLDIEGGNYDGKGISLDRNPTDAIRGNRIELELIDAEVRGRDITKVIILGRAFDGIDSEGTLVAEYIEFRENGSKISQNFFREIDAILFNNFSGGEGRTETDANEESKDLISSSGGYMIVKESGPLRVFPASKMSFQVESPNFALSNFVTSDPSLTLEDEFAIALGAASSVAELYLEFDGIEDITFEKDGNVTVAYGQKFLAKTNNIQRIDLLMSVERDDSRPVGSEFDFSGDLVLSIFELATDIDCPTDAVPEDLIDFDPETTPIVEISFSQQDLETLGVQLTDETSIVSFNFAGTLIADPNIEPTIVPNKFYSFLLGRRGDNRTGTIVLTKGFTVAAGKQATGVELTTKESFAKQDSKYFEFDPNTKRFVSDSNASLWYVVHSDSVEITDGTAYADNGVSISVPKTEDFVGESEISFFVNNIPLSDVGEGSDNYVVLSHVDELVSPGVHPRTGNFVFTRIKDGVSVSMVNDSGLQELLEDTYPLLLARVKDTNVRDAQTVSGVFDKPGLIKTDRIIVEDPGADLLGVNLINRILVPDTECQCGAMYRIVEVECLQELAGDLNSDGTLTSDDILELLNVVGNTINSEVTERSILGGVLDIVDFIKSDLNDDDTVDGTDIELLEDAVDGYVNFTIPEKIRFLVLRLENVLEEDNFPEIFNDTLGTGITVADDDQITFITETENEALIIRPGDVIEVDSGIDSGTYIIVTKVVESDNQTVAVTVTDIEGEEVVFDGSIGFNVTVTSGTAVNILADNPALVDIPFKATNYEISFIESPFEERFIDICDLRRFIESNFIEEKKKDNCLCVEEECLPEDDCAPKLRNQKYLPGDLYIPDGEILSAPGVPYHGDFEYSNVTIPIPPGTITNCAVDLYNTFIKAEDSACKTSAGFPAMKYSDGTFVGCDDLGFDTDITKGRVKISHAICSLFVDGMLDGYGDTDGYAEVDETVDNTEAITENFLEDAFDTFSDWIENAGNNTTITNISHPVGVNTPAVFDLTTSTDTGERFGRLDIPVASQNFDGDFIIDFTATRTVWPDTSLTSGSVSAFFTVVIENADGSVATLKLGWRTFAATGNTELFYSGVIEDASMVVISTFDYSIDAPELTGEPVLFRLRRISDVVTAYYLTPDSIDDADLISFGQYIRLGGNPDVQPGSGTVGLVSYEVSQNNSPNAGESFFTRLSEVVVRSEYTSADDLTQLIASRDQITDEVDRFTLTFPLNLTRRTVITSAIIKLTSQVTGTIGDTINVIPLDIVNADNIGKIFNIPITQNASYINSFIPGTVTFGDQIEVDVTTIVVSMLAAAGHLPGQHKGFIFEPDSDMDSSLAVASTAELEVTYLDTTTGIIFKVGTNLDKDTGILTLNTKNILYDDLVRENRTVLNFGVYLKKAGFSNSDIEINIADLTRVGIGTCFDSEILPEDEDCFFIVGDTATGTFVEGPFPCQFHFPQP